MLQRHTHAILAPATAAGRAAVGVVRVSGQGLAPFVRALLGFEPQPRHAHYTPFRDARGQAIDEGLALWFPAPHSYTGEDVLELQGHGGPVVMQMLIERCREVGQPLLPGLRLADPGEFTQRAFLNGKLDLAQAEAVADLIDAGTQAAARSASASLGGAFSREVQALREPLVALRVLLESTLDFPEEEIDILQQHDVVQRLQQLAHGLASVQTRARQGALLREGLQIVLAGQPNVGKSSLLNALAGADVAIVTEVAGTTRDPVRQALQIEGIPLHVVDTAGLRDSDDLVERIGIERSWAAVREADAVLFVHDLARRGTPDYDAADAAIASTLGLAGAESPGDRVLHVYNKCDLAGPPAGTGALGVSARSGEGLDKLRQALLAQVGWQALPEGVFIARARHLQALGDTQRAVAQAQAHLAGPYPALELCAEALREAHQALGDIVGAMTADDLLGEIFARFCIGK